MEGGLGEHWVTQMKLESEGGGTGGRPSVGQEDAGSLGRDRAPLARGSELQDSQHEVGQQVG